MGNALSVAECPACRSNYMLFPRRNAITSARHRVSERQLQQEKEIIMRLNIGGTGTGKPYCKYNSKADKWFVRGLDGEDTEIERPTFVVDFENIATGWMRFREGEAPERVMDPSIDRAAPSPGDGFKRGFVVMIYSLVFFGGAAEFASASLHISGAIRDIYAEYDAGKGSNPGKLPVIACKSSQAMKDRHGTNYRPTFTIVEWVDRPAELPSVSHVEASDIWRSSAAAPTPTEGAARQVTSATPKPASPPLSKTVF
jgi:hypothetical protein